MSSFNILTVCTGNICRSALAKELLKITLQDAPVEVDSSGVYAMVGETMPDPQLDIARELGVSNPENHVAKQIETDQIEAADLILAMSREHRREIVERFPKALRKVFTIRELARIIDSLVEEDYEEITASDPVSRMRQAVELAVMGRGIAVPADFPEDDDVVDPYRQPQEVYELSRNQVVAAVNSVSVWLRGVSA